MTSDHEAVVRPSWPLTRSPSRLRRRGGRGAGPAHRGDIDSGHQRRLCAAPLIAGSGASDVREVYREGSAGGCPGARRSQDARSQLDRHRAHPARARPRGRKRGGQGAHSLGSAWLPMRQAVEEIIGRAPAAHRTIPFTPRPKRCLSSRCVSRCTPPPTTSAPSTSCSPSYARATASAPPDPDRAGVDLNRARQGSSNCCTVARRCAVLFRCCPWPPPRCRPSVPPPVMT